MDRRSFLRLLASGLIAPTLDVEKLLWVPGAKKIFLPTFIPTSNLLRMDAVFRQIYSADRIRALFERDEKFYELITNKPNNIKGRAPFMVPLNKS